MENIVPPELFESRHPTAKDVMSGSAVSVVRGRLMETFELRGQPMDIRGSISARIKNPHFSKLAQAAPGSSHVLAASRYPDSCRLFRLRCRNRDAST